MIQQGGYGQIYGNMGGGAVGASIFSAARESVNFARMVERQRLNLQQRQLRMQEAQMAANADLSKRRLDLEDTRLQLESRRLDLQDRLRKEEKERTLRAYDAKMEELARREEEAWMKAEEQARKEQLALEQQQRKEQQGLEQQNFKNIMDLSSSGGSVVDENGTPIAEGYNYARIPGTDSLARIPVGKQKAVEMDKRLWETITGDIERSNKLSDEARRSLSKQRERIEELQEIVKSDKSAQAQLDAAIAEYNESEKRSKGSAETKAIEFYRDAVLANPNLPEAVPYNKWKKLSWSNMDEREAEIVTEMAESRKPHDMEMLAAVVSMGGVGIDVDAVDAWRRAAAVPNSAARSIKPKDWLMVDWNDDKQKYDCMALLASSRPEDLAILKAFIEEKAKRRSDEGPSLSEQRKSHDNQGEQTESKPSNGPRFIQRSNFIQRSDKGMNIYVNGKRQFIPMWKWESMTEDERMNIRSSVKNTRNIVKDTRKKSDEMPSDNDGGQAEQKSGPSYIQRSNRGMHIYVNGKHRFIPMWKWESMTEKERRDIRNGVRNA